MRLLAPESFRKANAKQRKKYCNGCGGAATGPLERLVNWFVPNHIWGIPVRHACDIHDWMYGHGKRKSEKFVADMYFLCNLLILCSVGSKWKFPIRAARCFTYFMAVTLFGSKFYVQKAAKREVKKAA